MFKHRLIGGVGNGETMIVISGNALFTNAQEMRGALDKALDSCEHLTIDVGGIEAFDGTFLVLLCSLHRGAELGSKSIRIKGILNRCEDDRISYAMAKGCLFDRKNERCLLWHSIVDGGNRATGRVQVAESP